MRTPRCPFVANVIPRSVIARRAGPAVLMRAYGPVTSAPMTLFRGVVTRQGPKRALSSPPPISTQADCGVTPNGRLRRRYVGSKAKAKRSVAMWEQYAPTSAAAQQPDPEVGEGLFERADRLGALRGDRGAHA